METQEKDTATDGWRPNRDEVNDWLQEHLHMGVQKVMNGMMSQR